MLGSSQQESKMGKISHPDETPAEKLSFSGERTRIWLLPRRVWLCHDTYALAGDPRRKIQIDLLNFYKILKCGCCSNSGGTLSPSMHDTSIMLLRWTFHVPFPIILYAFLPMKEVLYTLAQEHGDLINLHDWFQSFKASISSSGKKGLKKLASPKKRKENTSSQNNSDALLQARFCRAVMELQITGLLRMPSKRRPDCVQRVAFGV
ncbi:hypothetical protein H5410_058969 [Solanum commersonii]|uniref:Origin recognition complex subunit 3 winged helix C-terminal domain-containing protein n=1 Tax=Solanum commersonii TaxID=4109 RepID=A0A9J5W136_SOLCO|nr:hypothetical protein H5410_058969 [Solanum commersonii]